YWAFYCDYIGFDNFYELLCNAHDMNLHFQNTPLEQTTIGTNLPVILDVIGIWYNNFFDAQTQLFFEPPVPKDDKIKAKCKFCTNKKTYLTLSKGATTSLHAHITNVYKVNIMKTVSSENFPVVASRSSESILRKALVK
ncbi:24872_t:CDS:2, partial [Racocetra persica]